VLLYRLYTDRATATLDGLQVDPPIGGAARREEEKSA
jgi:hypothetical protein